MSSWLLYRLEWCYSTHKSRWSI